MKKELATYLNNETDKRKARESAQRSKKHSHKIVKVGNYTMNVAIIKRSSGSIEISEIDNKDKRIFGMTIEVYKPMGTTNYEISWSSIGSVDIAKGERYMNLMKLAISIAKKENAKLN